MIAVVMRPAARHEAPPLWALWLLRAYYEGIVTARRRGAWMAATGLVMGFLGGLAL